MNESIYIYIYIGMNVVESAAPKKMVLLIV